MACKLNATPQQIESSPIYKQRNGGSEQLVMLQDGDVDSGARFESLKDSFLVYL